LYLVDTQEGGRAVFNFDVFASPTAPVWPQLMRIKQGRHAHFSSA